MDINSISNSINSVITTLESNPIIPLIASGGLTVWVISNLKAIWNTAKNFFLSIISFDIFNTYEDTRGIGYRLKDRQTLFNSLVTDAPTIWERTMNLDFSNGEGWSVLDREKRNLTYGFSIKWMFGKLVFCNRGYKQDSQKVMVNMNLQVFFASKKKFIERLDNEICNRLKIETEKSMRRNIVNIFYGSANHGMCSEKNKRRLDSIFTNNNEHIELFNYIQDFINNKDTYIKMNYPYKLSVLLSGVPGAGKSSTILAIASALNRNVEYINLSTSSITTLMDKLNDNTNQKIFVFEDIDALNTSSSTNRDKTDNANNQTCVINTESSIKIMSLSLSDLLNLTDGLLSSDGAICIFTTNHIEKLDPALLRAGRMNKVIEFTYLNSSTANKMIKKYLGHEIQDLKDDIKPAELQEDLLRIVLKKNDEIEIMKKYQRH